MPDLTMYVDTAVTVPVNLLSLIDNADFVTRLPAVAFDAPGLELIWNFTTPYGVLTQTPVVPASSGDYAWVNLGSGMYALALPAGDGTGINNDRLGFGWFSGTATGILSWRGPSVQFATENVVNALVAGQAPLLVAVPDALETMLAGQYAPGMAGWILGEQLPLAVKFLQGHRVIDTTQDPWEMVVLDREDPTIELLRQQMYDVYGNPINTAVGVVGRMISPP
jgi:hypothetical protein